VVLTEIQSHQLSYYMSKSEVNDFLSTNVIVLVMISEHFVFYYPSQFATFSFCCIKTQATLHLSFVSLLCIYIIGIWTLHDSGKGAKSEET
jgi:hypothetical protein